MRNIVKTYMKNIPVPFTTSRHPQERQPPFKGAAHTNAHSSDIPSCALAAKPVNHTAPAARTPENCTAKQETPSENPFRDFQRASPAYDQPSSVVQGATRRCAYQSRSQQTPLRCKRDFCRQPSSQTESLPEDSRSEAAAPPVMQLLCPLSQRSTPSCWSMMSGSMSGFSSAGTTAYVAIPSPSS